MEQLLVDKVATDDFNLAKMGIQLVVNTTSKPAPMRQITTNPDQPPLVIERSTPPSSSAPIDTITSTTTPSAENTTTETGFYFQFDFFCFSFPLSRFPHFSFVY